MKRSARIVIIFGVLFVVLVLFFELQLVFVLPLWIFVLFAFTIGLIFSLWLTPHRYWFTNIEKLDWLFIFVYGFIFAQTALAMSFWPFNCVTSAAVLVVVMYVLWDVWSYKKKNKLNAYKIAADLIIFIGAVTILLATTKWLP